MYFYAVLWITMSSFIKINYSTSAAGGLRVEIQRADGKAIPGFTLNDCIEIIEVGTAEENKKRRPQAYIGRCMFCGLCEENCPVGAFTLTEEYELASIHKEDFILTGQLGDVMRESARAGLSWTRANAARLGVPREEFEKNTMHIHVPAGAIPKDGPSAGVTMATAMVSSLTGIPVRKDVAMTGEITLRGRVLPIGGLKSKILAAHLSGAKIVILPKKNEKD